MLRKRWGWTPRDRVAGPDSKPPDAALVESSGRERSGKGRPRPVRYESGRRTKVNRWQRVESVGTPSKSGSSRCPETSPGETCLAPGRWPAQRRREPDSGSSGERGNLPLRCQGRTPSGRPTRGRVPMRSGGTDQPVGAMKPSNVGGARGLNGPVLSEGQPAMGGARG